MTAFYEKSKCLLVFVEAVITIFAAVVFILI